MGSEMCIRDRSHIEEGVKAIGVQLTSDEIAYLEEPYVPHALVGVMRENP